MENKKNFLDERIYLDQAQNLSPKNKVTPFTRKKLAHIRPEKIFTTNQSEKIINKNSNKKAENQNFYVSPLNKTSNNNNVSHNTPIKCYVEMYDWLQAFFKNNKIKVYFLRNYKF